MKKRLIYLLLTLFLLFSIGVGLTMIYSSNTATDLRDVINLHKVDQIRQDLIIKSRIVQSNLYAVGTTFGKELDVIIDNVLEMDAAIKGCTVCHHSEDMTKQLKDLQNDMEKYKEAISYLVTTTANEVRIERLKIVALGIGDSILTKAQEMAFTASKRLNDKTVKAIDRINHTGMMLLATILFSFVIAIFIAITLTRQITRPINELLNATRQITAGNLDHVITYKDETEFGELAANFNTMSAALKSSYENIKRHQAALQESERRFRTLSEFSQDWEYWISENMDIVFMSPSCERITGYKNEEFTKNPSLLYEIIHPEDVDIYTGHIKDFNKQDVMEQEFRIITKNGEVKWLSHVCGPIYVDNEFKGRRVSNRDITDRKRLEEQLIQSQKMESLGLFAGGIAHDLNNILTVIDGYSRLTKMAISGDDEKIKGYVQQVLDASRRAQELTSTLLSFSRRKIIKPYPVKISKVIDDVSKLLGRLMGEDIEMEVAIEKPENEFMVFADPYQIEQVMMNLATNARDAMPSGGKLKITVSPIILDERYARRQAVKPGRYMMISVSDTGIGMDKDELSHIFEPFFTTKEKGKGTGLGLSIVYGIIKQHEGFINVYSEKGHGTTFKIYLPAMEDEKTMTAIQTETTVQMDLRGNETILLAEDNESVRDYLKNTISDYGYKVLSASDGEIAIKLYEENKEDIDMVILDVVMPKKNGKEVYDYIRGINPAIKAIFISGYTEDILTSKGIYEEGLEFVPKPIDTNLLLAKMRNSLNKQS